MTPVNVIIPDHVLSMFEEMDGLLSSFVDKHSEAWGAAVGRARVHGQSMDLSIAAWLMEHIDEFAEHVRAAQAIPGDTPEDDEASLCYGATIVAAYAAGLNRALAASAMLDKAGVAPLHPAAPSPPPPAPPPPTIGIDNAASFVAGPSTLQ